MTKVLAVVFGLAVTLAVTLAGELLPVRAWPRVIAAGDKQVVNPTVEQCVAAGYRLIPEKPKTPDGKRIVAEGFEQDPARKEMVRWVIAYEDVPKPPAPKPVAVTNVPAGRVQFQFTTNGTFRGAVWLDAPKTNGAGK